MTSTPDRIRRTVRNDLCMLFFGPSEYDNPGALCELARPFLEGGFRDDYQVCAGNAEKVF
jgi:hypothetical protein